MKKIVVLLLVCVLLISGVSAASAKYKTAVSLNSDELFLNIRGFCKSPKAINS